MNETYFIAVIILVTVMAAVALFVFQSRRVSKKRIGEMTEVYNEIVSKDKLTIVDEERLDNKIFALDHLKRIFVFVYNYERPVYDIVRLDNITGCKVKETGNSITVGAGKKAVSEEHITQIHLSFMHSDKTVVQVPVYNEIQDSLQEKIGLAAVAEAWQRKINAVIAS